MTQQEPMTEYGYNKLSKEILYAKEVLRPAIAEEIDTARALGDLKENAEYHAAKEKQLLMEKRIAEVSDLLTKAQVIDPSTFPHKRVSFGSTVELLDINTEEEITYIIVGGAESNPEKGLISFNSPLAKQLLGKEEDTEFTAKLPGGERTFEVLSISFKEIKFED